MSKKNRFMEAQRKRNLLVERGRAALENRLKEEATREITVHFKRTQGTLVTPIKTDVQSANGDIDSHVCGGMTKIEHTAIEFAKTEMPSWEHNDEQAVRSYFRDCTRAAVWFWEEFSVVFLEEQQKAKAMLDAARMNENKRATEANLPNDSIIVPEEKRLILPEGVNS